MPDLEKTFTIQLVVSLLMLGIVLVTQFINYPLYRVLSADQLTSYEQYYLLKALLLYGPIMIVELITAVRLTKKVKNFELHSTFRTNITVIGIIWGITLFFELPAHIILLVIGFNSVAYQTLIYGNFTQLILWFIKCRALLKITPHMFRGEEIYYQEFL